MRMDEEASRGGKPAKGFHFTQAPSFVTGEEEKTMDWDKTLEEDGDGDEDSDESNEEQEDDEGEDTDAGEDAAGDDDENDLAETPFIPHTTDKNEEKDDASRGLGSGVRAGIGGFGSKSGIGLGFKAASTNEAPQDNPNKQSEEPVSSPAVKKGGIGSNRPSLSGALPTQFDTTPTQPQRSFLRDNVPVSWASIQSLEEGMHFSKVSGTFGAKVLAKMGWQAGTGLGVSGTGIVTLVERKMRPKPSMGKESNLKLKQEVEHQTYEQILQNAESEAQAAGIGKIYNATSGQMREGSSLAEIAS
ncbi:hypothetical protein Clacol_008696 [Clathrus columnatus]|uniref:G-patch domain-containing protein n=1 Tax=Clathrus columnatus TaxID=1419009 RepID=A0AAV5AIF1_9AGAM|nr:hypothetical protein Clacol_008696 [Clathrus columnatus]